MKKIVFPLILLLTSNINGLPMPQLALGIIVGSWWVAKDICTKEYKKNYDRWCELQRLKISHSPCSANGQAFQQEQDRLGERILTTAFGALLKGAVVTTGSFVYANRRLNQRYNS